MLRYAVFIAPSTKNVLHQKRQMLNLFTPSYRALLKIIAHYNGVSKPNIIFLIHTHALETREVGPLGWVLAAVLGWV